MNHTKELFSLEGKVAIVTGGRGMYGASISRGLCEMGAAVIIASRNGEKCDAYAATLRNEGYDAVGMSMDLMEDASIRAFCREVADRYGKIDILVNNAVDRSNMVNLENATREKLQNSASTNLQGQILLTQAVLEHMIPAKSGSIINIGSMPGVDCPHFPFYPGPWGDQPINYTTEKWAMVGFTKYMAGYCGKYNIRVNCIAPGGYWEGPTDDPFYKTYMEHCPLGRWADENDIKGPVAFLASDAAGYVTGATLAMDGGWTIW